MRGRVDRRKMAMARVRARAVVENRNIASGDLYCEKRLPHARAGGMSS